jgi:hypothetical protein
MPSFFARLATAGFFMSRTETSQDGQAIRLTSRTVSSHAGQPALKTSICRFAAIISSSLNDFLRRIFYLTVLAHAGHTPALLGFLGHALQKDATTRPERPA